MKQETSAGAYPGARLMGLSLKRAGDSMIEATGRPGAAGESPVMAPKGAKFIGGAMQRAGSTEVAGMPAAPTAPEAYKGGTGTGQGKGSQGAAKDGMGKRSCTGANC
jgi:hypothetical protein